MCFLSHPIDGSGAPNQLIRILEEFATKIEPAQIHVVAPFIDASQLLRLERLSVRIRGRMVARQTAVGKYFIRLQLGLRKSDFVLMNTVAVPERYQRVVLSALRGGRLAHAYWFIHEDSAQHKRFSPHFLDAAFLREVRELIEQEQLEILVPAIKLKTAYNALFDTTKVESILLSVDLPATYRERRQESDYRRINFFLSGPSGDGRKGHFIALAAFQRFLTTYYAADPGRYREFDVTFVGIGDDFVSRQVVSVGNAVLGPRLRTFPSVPHDDALEFAHDANVVICCSLSEACPLYVTEGMMMGHVVLRNQVSGLDEQLKDGVNGLLISGDNEIDAFADAIERLLNRSKTSDERLRQMGRASQELSEPFRHQSYASVFGVA